MFTGSLRDNLDPFGVYSDERLTEILAEVGLAAQVRASRLLARPTLCPTQLASTVSWQCCMLPVSTPYQQAQAFHPLCTHTGKRARTATRLPTGYQLKAAACCRQRRQAGCVAAWPAAAPTAGRSGRCSLCAWRARRSTKCPCSVWTRRRRRWTRTPRSTSWCVALFPPGFGASFTSAHQKLQVRLIAYKLVSEAAVAIE